MKCLLTSARVQVNNAMNDADEEYCGATLVASSWSSASHMLDEKCEKY